MTSFTKPQLAARSVKAKLTPLKKPKQADLSVALSESETEERKHEPQTWPAIAIT
jgi:hypothetical protein